MLRRARDCRSGKKECPERKSRDRRLSSATIPTLSFGFRTAVEPVYQPLTLSKVCVLWIFLALSFLLFFAFFATGLFVFLAIVPLLL